jgi:hypothetical protein
VYQITIKNNNIMATLKEQLTQVTDWTGFERQSAQECNVIESKMAPNGCGAEFILVDFFSASGHPYDTKGITVVVIEEDYIYDIDKTYVKSIFNK